MGAAGPGASPAPHRAPPQGVTRLLLTRVPFFRELIVSSFSCAACGWADAEIQPAGSIQERGVRYALAVGSRQVSGGAPKPPGAREVFGGGGWW